jgi:hypothetical protein
LCFFWLLFFWWGCWSWDYRFRREQ